jgi:GT2 family glycosyltransferase
MPLYNAAAHLDASIESILAQTFADFELVVVDDASTDGSREMAHAWARRDGRVRVLENETRIGAVECGNRAVHAARASVCARMDADDLSHPERLRLEREILAADRDVMLVGTLCEWIDASGRIIRPRDRSRLVYRSKVAPFPHGSTMFRRDAFLAIGGYRPPCHLWSDLDLFYRLAERGRLLVLPEVLYRHRVHLQSVTLQAPFDALSRAMARRERSLALRRAGKDDAAALQVDPSNGSHPRANRQALHAFASRRVWAGESAGILGPLFRTRLCPLDRTLAKLWVLGVGGAVSPLAIRFLLRTLVRLRDAAAAPVVRPGAPVEWRFA